MLINLEKSRQRNAIRLLRLLSKKPSNGFIFKAAGNKYIFETLNRKHSFETELVAELIQKKLVTNHAKTMQITDAGSICLKQMLNPDYDIAEQHRECMPVSFDSKTGQPSAFRNGNESPLMRLFTRKTKAGTTYISIEEFQAGELLRRDFEQGQLQPKISASLQGAIGNGSASGLSQACDINDFAIDARNRVSCAIERLGPELSGVTLDVCCFLKGLELVETERQWPPRSAKLMLKTALSILVYHYGIAGHENTRSGKFTVWNGTQYRPSIR